MERFIDANDELRIFRGDDYKIKDGIYIHQPTLNEICDFGELSYWNMITTLTAVPADLKWQLDEINIDYTTVSDFQLFYEWLCHRFSQNQTKLIFGDLDFNKFLPVKRKDDNSIVLINPDSNVFIDEYAYLLIVNALREIHCLERNNEVPGNNSTKRFLIEDAKEKYLLNKDKEPRSIFKNLISSMINCEGFKRDDVTVWDMKVGTFFDSVNRISKMKTSWVLMQSGYSGFGIDLKKIDKKYLDWKGEL